MFNAIDFRSATAKSTAPIPSDLSDKKVGDTVRVHCCDSCVHNAGLQPKYPPDSGRKSWLCEVCGHHGIGSAVNCTIGDWLTLKPNAALSGPHD